MRSFRCSGYSMINALIPIGSVASFVCTCDDSLRDNLIPFSSFHKDAAKLLLLATMHASSSFVKTSHPIYAPYNRLEVQKFAVSQDMVEILLHEFWKKLHYKKKDFSKYTLAGQCCPQDDFKNYMGIISRKFHKENPLCACFGTSVFII